MTNTEINEREAQPSLSSHAQMEDKNRKPKNILGLRHLNYVEGEDFAAYYTSLRNTICNNLRKKGDIINEAGDVLLEDEILSPTFEDVIVLWSLERIDPNLPESVNKYFGHQLDKSGSYGLRQLQEDIFKVIPMMLETMENVGDYAEVKMEEDDYMEVPAEDRKHNVMVKDDNDDIKTEEDLNIKSEHRLPPDEPDDFIDDDHETTKKSHFPPLMFSCPNCERTFKINYLRDHLQKVHRMNKRICAKELDIVKSVQKAECSLCFAKVWYKERKSHFRRVHNIRPFSEDKNVAKTKSESITCPLCPKEMKKCYLRKHLKTVHSEEDIEPWLPPPRNKKGRNKAALGNEYQVCTVCGKEVKRLSMKAHMNNKHENVLVKEDDGNVEKTMCTICGMMFTKKFISSHTTRCAMKKEGGQSKIMSNMKVDKNLFCETCKRHFFSLEHMKDHKCAHLKCDLCDAEFIRVRFLENHKKGHAGQTLFPCDFCEGTFLSRKNLLAHRRFSHDPKYQQLKFQCMQCDKKFNQRSAMNKHMVRVHTEKNFKCMECGKSYKTKDALKVHMHFIHTKSGFCKNCPDCGKEILSLGEFKLHREVMCKALKKDKAKAERSSEDAHVDLSSISSNLSSSMASIPQVMEVSAQDSVPSVQVTTIQYALKLDQL